MRDRDREGEGEEKRKRRGKNNRCEDRREREVRGREERRGRQVERRGNEKSKPVSHLSEEESALACLFRTLSSSSSRAGTVERGRSALRGSGRITSSAEGIFLHQFTPSGRATKCV